MTLGKTVITLASAVSAVAILGSLVSLGKDNIFLMHYGSLPLSIDN